MANYKKIVDNIIAQRQKMSVLEKEGTYKEIRLTLHKFSTIIFIESYTEFIPYKLNV